MSDYNNYFWGNNLLYHSVSSAVSSSVHTSAVDTFQLFSQRMPREITYSTRTTLYNGVANLTLSISIILLC